MKTAFKRHGHSSAARRVPSSWGGFEVHSSKEAFDTYPICGGDLSVGHPNQYCNDPPPLNPKEEIDPVKPYIKVKGLKVGKLKAGLNSIKPGWI